MADFRAFTIAASVTAIVLGAGIGAALGAISGPQPPLVTTQQGSASSTMAGPAPRVSPAMGDATMDHTAAGAGGKGPGLPAEELIAQSAVLPDHPDGRTSAVIPRSYGRTGNYQGRLHGWAKVSYSAAKRTLSVTVTAFGLPPGPHAAHLHLGTCQDQGGVRYMLMDYVANASGDIADQTRTVTGVGAAPPSGGWYVNLHLGDGKTILAHGMPTLSFRPELCANITSVQTAGHR